MQNELAAIVYSAISRMGFLEAHAEHVARWWSEAPETLPGREPIRFINEAARALVGEASSAILRTWANGWAMSEQLHPGCIFGFAGRDAQRG